MQNVFNSYIHINFKFYRSPRSPTGSLLIQSFKAVQNSKPLWVQTDYQVVISIKLTCIFTAKVEAEWDVYPKCHWMCLKFVTSMHFTNTVCSVVCPKPWYEICVKNRPVCILCTEPLLARKAPISSGDHIVTMMHPWRPRQLKILKWFKILPSQV